jgi:enamine deaminase RidA (YjgF/YER057c/UK114 family)
MASMSPATRAGELLFVSGQVALDESGAVVGLDDPRAQVEQVFANLDRVLAHAGSDLSRLVHLTAFITDASVYPPYAEVKSRLFRDLAAPSSTAVVVTALLHPGLLIEVEAVARITESGS